MDISNGGTRLVDCRLNPWDNSEESHDDDAEDDNRDCEDRPF